MKTLLAIHSYEKANDMVVRNWPYYLRAGADKIIGIGRTDSNCKFPDGIESFPIGKDEYVNGDNLPSRLVRTFERMLMYSDYDLFVVIEPDLIFYKPLEFTGGVAAHLSAGPISIWTASAWQNPWCADRENAKRIVAAGDELIKEGDIQHGMPDRFFCLIKDRMGVQCQNIPGFSRNTIHTFEDAEMGAKVCAYGNGVFIHGVKTDSILRKIESVWEEHANNIENIFAEKVRTQSDINEHLPTLRCYASKCESVTEFGVRGIVSTWALLAAKPKRLTSYDYVHPKQFGGDIEKVCAAAKEIGTQFSFHIGDTREIEIEPTDMLLIDTLHTEPQMRSELARHSSKVRKFIAMHDTFTYGEKGEVQDTKGIMVAIREFLNANNGKWRIAFQTDANNGLMVLERIA